MNKLKMSLALIALMMPLLLCAKERHIKLEIVHSKHKTLVESIPVEAFFDDESKELILDFSQDWKPVTIEITSKEGNVVYRNVYIPHANSTLSTSLENIPTGVYELTISDERVTLTGELVYEN